MKNSIKLGALALALAVSFTACSGKKSTSGTDSVKTDSAKVDTTKKDTTAKDTSKMKMSADTTKKKM